MSHGDKTSISQSLLLGMLLSGGARGLSPTATAPDHPEEGAN